MQFDYILELVHDFFIESQYFMNTDWLDSKNIYLNIDNYTNFTL